jgi:hypothetical protein
MRVMHANVVIMYIFLITGDNLSRVKKIQEHTLDFMTQMKRWSDNMSYPFSSVPPAAFSIPILQCISPWRLFSSELMS